MGYSIVDFATSLNIDRCKIWNTPNLIFLCGGKVASKGAYLSARDYFYRHLKTHAVAIAARVKLAEDVNAWFRGDIFPDLLELENYLADLADITVLFVESPGSIAELGAFAASNELRPKTLPVINTFYDSNRSFISEGPVLKLKNENSKLVHYYEWDPNHVNRNAALNEFSEMAVQLTQFLNDRDKDRVKQLKFDETKHGHALLMVAALIEIAGVATTTDIASCLKALGCNFGHAQLRRYLSLLESMSFIKEVLRSNQAFYVSETSEPFIRFAYKTGAHLKNQERIRAAIRSGLDPLSKRIFLKALEKRAALCV